MAKKCLNESRKSTIQKVVAFTPHSNSSEHSSSSSKHKKSNGSTRSGSVDTSPRFQKTQLPDWDSVSTQPVAVSTLDPVPRRPVLQNWDSVSTHSMVVSTHSG
ncbi:hypothetical protein Taro_004398 [Colocasia esculenta]|uniref:Uncharacterized protein n=1 Tax=Colocasia esculenta TaxID=4460 RepID=A0A843TM83_COLES|nr:hypothetical protein [Colocasia esculenta]